jgi:hypothetical protein
MKSHIVRHEVKMGSLNSPGGETRSSAECGDEVLFPREIRLPLADETWHQTCPIPHRTRPDLFKRKPMRRHVNFERMKQFYTEYYWLYNEIQLTLKRDIMIYRLARKHKLLKVLQQDLERGREKFGKYNGKNLKKKKNRIICWQILSLCFPTYIKYWLTES